MKKNAKIDKMLAPKYQYLQQLKEAYFLQNGFEQQIVENVQKDIFSRVKGSTKTYSAINGDRVDELVGVFILKKRIKLPITRVSQGNYIFGTKTVMFTEKNDDLYVVGNGNYIPLEKFLELNLDLELEKVRLMPSDMFALLHGNKLEAVAQHQSLNPVNANISSKELMKILMDDAFKPEQPLKKFGNQDFMGMMT